jgi:hypothetical protein
MSCVLRASLAEKSVGSAMACGAKDNINAAAHMLHAPALPLSAAQKERQQHGSPMGSNTAGFCMPNGRPAQGRTSSNELVCRDCVPPRTAARASTVVRMMLL